MSEITFSLRETTDMETIKSMITADEIFLSVCSKEYAASRPGIPTILYEGMYVYLRAPITVNGTKGSAALNLNTLSLLGVAHSYKEACEYIEEKMHNYACDYTMEELNGLLSKLKGVPNPYETADDVMPEIIVLSNNEKLYGSRVILNKEALDECSQRLGGDIYILPSNVHEVICMKATDGVNVEDLRMMVKDINPTLDPGDILSYDVYIYKHQEHLLKVA